MDECFMFALLYLEYQGIVAEIFKQAKLDQLNNTTSTRKNELCFVNTKRAYEY